MRGRGAMARGEGNEGMGPVAVVRVMASDAVVVEEPEVAEPGATAHATPSGSC
jgi:hypothetical protein